MNDRYLEKITDLLLSAVNAGAGDKITLVFDSECLHAAHILARKAYALGAACVDPEFQDQYFQAAAIRGTAEYFFFPAYLQEKYRETSQPDWKTINILSESDADAFEGLPAERSAAYFRAYIKSREIKRKAVMSSQFPWTVTFLPSKRMAKLAFPDLPVSEAIEKYWEGVIQSLYLDADNPVDIWHDKMALADKRSTFLNELNAEALHFSGPGTDLTVGLSRNMKWLGGYDISASGERFMANIPTEEIFTSPDYRRVEGRVRLTRPFVMHRSLGPIPVNAWFEFRNGKVVDFGADRGRETLDAFFSLDERSIYLGEIALVDPYSPIACTGFTYYNGLYDENTACHMAFGKGFPFLLKEPGDYSDGELNIMGMNTGGVHEDAMIGGPEVDVTALLKNGERKELIKDGKYLI